MTNNDLTKIIEIIREGMNTTLDNVKNHIESLDKTENSKDSAVTSQSEKFVKEAKKFPRITDNLPNNSGKSDSCDVTAVDEAPEAPDATDQNKSGTDIHNFNREMIRIAKSAKVNGYVYNLLFLITLEDILKRGVNPDGLKEYYRKTMEDSSWVEEFIDKWVADPDCNLYAPKKTESSNDLDISNMNVASNSTEEKQCEQDCKLQKDYVAEYDKLRQELVILTDIASMEPSHCEYIVNAFKKYYVKNGCQVVINTVRTTPYHNTTGTSLHGSVVSIFTNYIFNRAWYDITHDGSSSIKVVLNIKPSDYMGDYDLRTLLNETLAFLEQYFYVTTAFPNVTRYNINNTDYVSIDFEIGYTRNSTVESARIVIDNAVMTIPMVFCKFLDRISEIERNKAQ